MTDNGKDDVQEELDPLREEVEMLRTQRDTAAGSPGMGETGSGERTCS